MKVNVTLDEEEVKEAVKQYLESAGYGVEDAEVRLRVSSGGSGIDPRVNSGPRFRRAEIEDVKT
jgi:hypothetical protein